jgi:hypothetical protein
MSALVLGALFFWGFFFRTQPSKKLRIKVQERLPGGQGLKKKASSDPLRVPPWAETMEYRRRREQAGLLRGGQGQGHGGEDEGGYVWCFGGLSVIIKGRHLGCVVEEDLRGCLATRNFELAGAFDAEGG